jgi:DNA-binding protein HU-beta
MDRRRARDGQPERRRRRCRQHDVASQLAAGAKNRSLGPRIGKKSRIPRHPTIDGLVVSALLYADLLEIGEDANVNCQGGYTVNKNDLVAAVADETGLSKADVGKAVDATFATIVKALRSKDDVRLVGFGTYTVTERSASQGRNPRTGQPIRIPASKQVKFRVGKGMKDAINK